MKKIAHFVLMVICVLLFTACMRIQPPTITAEPIRITPTVTKVAKFKTIASETYGPRKATWLGGNEFKTFQLKFYLTILTDERQFHEYFHGNELIEQKVKGMFDEEMLLIVEWGEYSSNSIKVDVTDVQIVSNQIDVTAMGGRTPPDEASINAGASAFAYIAIPRKDLDFSKPITFNLVNQGIVVAQEVLQPN